MLLLISILNITRKDNCHKRANCAWAYHRAMRFLSTALPLLCVMMLACPTEPPPTPVVDEPIAAYDPLPLVDPMIGTGGLGGEVIGLNPGASVPWGMTQTGPDTRHSTSGAPPFYHFGGYHYRDDQIIAFSHEHANGMGTNDFGIIAGTPASTLVCKSRVGAPL